MLFTKFSKLGLFWDLLGICKQLQLVFENTHRISQANRNDSPRAVIQEAPDRAGLFVSFRSGCATTAPKGHQKYGSKAFRPNSWVKATRKL